MGYVLQQPANQVMVDTWTRSEQVKIIEHSQPLADFQKVSRVFANAPNSSLESALESIFPDQQDETQLQKAQRIMAGEIDTLSDEELKVAITEFHYLLSTWFDEFEKSVFNNKTLQQILKEE